MTTKKITLFNCFGSYKNIQSTIKHLHPEQAQFLSTKKLKTTRSYEYCYPFLKKLGSLDLLVDSTKRAVMFGLLLSGFLLVFGIFILFAGIGIPFLLPIGLIFFIPFIIFMVMRTKLKAVDLPDSFNLFCIPFLSIIGEDMEKNGNVQLQLDLRGYEQSDKLIDDKKLSNHGYPKIRQCIYKDPFFDCHVDLAGKGKLYCTIISIVRQRKITKKNPRGKIKCKTKEKKQALVSIRLSQPMEASSETVPKCSIKSGKKRTTVSVKHKIRNYSDESEILRDVLKTIGEAYMRFNAIKQT